MDTVSLHIYFIPAKLATVSGVLLAFAKGMKREAGALCGARPALPPQR